MALKTAALTRIVWMLGIGFTCACVGSVTGQAAPAPKPASPAGTGSQQAWSWPQKSKNLKVLPKDTSPEKLRDVMRGFTKALGVRCTHCHVGKEGEPLSTYDFASDANPKKKVARGMYKMLGKVNDQLREIQPNLPNRVNMGCHTCHHGRPRPRTLAEEMTLTYDKAGADSAVAVYRDLRFRFLDAGAYDFREGTIEEVALYAEAKKDEKGTLSLCRLGADVFPESARMQHNLGEAALAAGDTALAIVALGKAVDLDPKRKAAVETLQKLRGTKSE